VNVIPGVPHIVQEIDRLGLTNIELDGELYCHGMTLEEISSIVSRQSNLHPRYFDMEYHIFDIVFAVPQEERTQIIEKLYAIMKLKGVRHIHIVPTYIVANLDEIMKLYDQFIEDGYEGFVLREKSAPYMRKRSTYMMKFKPKAFDVYKIVGYYEECDIRTKVPKGRLGSIECQGTDGTKFKVGTGYSAEQRKALWEIREMLPAWWLKIGYQNLTGANKVPYASRFVEILTSYKPPGDEGFEGCDVPDTSNFELSIDK
jgi:DNA ligase-1